MCALKIGGWAPIDLLLHDAEEARARQGRGRAADLRRRDARARSARRPAIGDGAYDGGWLDPLTSAIYPPESRRAHAPRAGLPDVPVEGLGPESPRGRPGAPAHRRARRRSRSTRCRADRIAEPGRIRSCGGIPRPPPATPRRRSVCAATI